LAYGSKRTGRKLQRFRSAVWRGLPRSGHRKKRLSGVY